MEGADNSLVSLCLAFKKPVTVKPLFRPSDIPIRGKWAVWIKDGDANPGGIAPTKVKIGLLLGCRIASLSPMQNFGITAPIAPIANHER